MSKIFGFGEHVKGYDIPVLNEREIRAAAGILFLFSIISFMNVILRGNFFPIKVFIVAFLIDFLIRLFVNPRFSPSLILGRLFVKNQDVEYVSAAPKKFAWYIGLFLVTYMMIVLVIFNYVGIINFLFCLFCLTFLFFESALGICLGCLFYSKVLKKDLELCAGGVCEVKKKEKIQKVSWIQTTVLIAFIIIIVLIASSSLLLHGVRAFTQYSSSTSSSQSYSSGSGSQQGVFNANSSLDSSQPSGCVVPQWAVDIGHEELYKEHHNCTE